MYGSDMESGGSIPAGEPLAGTPDAPLEPPGTGGLPGAGGALVLPVFFTLAAWAVDRFARSALGDWRYLPTAVLGLCAIYFAVLAVVVMAVNFDRAPGWVTRPSKLLFASKLSFPLALAVVVCFELVLAVRDRSVIDALSVVVIVGWGASIPETDRTSRLPRGLRWTRQWARVILPLWFVAVAVLHLR